MHEHQDSQDERHRPEQQLYHCALTCNLDVNESETLQHRWWEVAKGPRNAGPCEAMKVLGSGRVQNCGLCVNLCMC